MIMDQLQSTSFQRAEPILSDDLPSIRRQQLDKPTPPTASNVPLPSISHLFATADDQVENPLAANRESSLGPIRSRPLSTMTFSNANHLRHDPPPSPQSSRWMHRTNTSTSAFTGRMALRRLESSGSIASVASATSSPEMAYVTSPVLSPLGPSGLVRQRNPTASPFLDHETAPSPIQDDQGRRGSVTRRHTVGAADVPRSYVTAPVPDLPDPSSSASDCGYERSARAEDLLSVLRNGVQDGRDKEHADLPLTPTGRSRSAAAPPRNPMDVYNPLKRAVQRKRGIHGEHGSSTAAAPYGHRVVPSSASVYSHTSSLPSLSMSTASTRSTASASVSTTSLSSSSMGPSSQSSWSVHSRSSTLDDLEVHLDAQHLDPNYDRHLHPVSPTMEPKPFLPPRSSSLHLRNQAKREAEDAARREAYLAAQEHAYERQDSPVSSRSWDPSSPRFAPSEPHHSYPYQHRPNSIESSLDGRYGSEGSHANEGSLFALASAANASSRGVPTPRLPLRMSSRVDGQPPYRNWDPESHHHLEHKYHHPSSSIGQHYQHHAMSSPLVSSSSSAYSVLSPYSSSSYRALPPPSIRSSTSSYPSPHGSFVSLASAPAALPGNQHYGAPPASSTAKYECSTCGKRFTRPSSLKIHMHSHTGERPFGCSCGRKFSVHSNLRRHQKAHGHVAATGLDEEVLEAESEAADAEAESAQFQGEEGDSEHTPTEEVERKEPFERDADDDERMRSRSPSPIDNHTSPSTHSSMGGIDVEFEDAQSGLESASSPDDPHPRLVKRALGLGEEVEPQLCV